MAKKYFLFFLGLSIANANDHKLFQKGLELLNHNSVMANKFFMAAADKNYRPAIKALADSYMIGDGLPKDINKALLQYIRAADLGYGPAQFSVGILLQNGEAGFLNLPMAFYYLCLASVNSDLEDLQKDAAYYRDLVASKLTPNELMHIYRQLNKIL